MKEKNEPLVSIIIPVYNVEKYLEKCISSVIKQTYKNIEIILIDDGSNDNSSQICDAYEQRYTQIKVIHKANGGLSDARNAGLDIAAGAYVMFVDSDDYIAENMCEKLLSAVITNHADIGICNFLYVGDNDDTSYVSRNNLMPIKDEILSGRNVIEEKIRERKSWYWVVSCNKLYRIELFRLVRFPKDKRHEDEYVFFDIFNQCKKVACVSEPLYYYVQRTESIMHSAYSIRHLDICEAMFERAEKMMNYDYSSTCIIHTAIRGISLMGPMFNMGLDKDAKYHEKYLSLITSFRKLNLLRLLKNAQRLHYRVAIILAFISPKMLWRIRNLLKR